MNIKDKEQAIYFVNVYKERIVSKHNDLKLKEEWTKFFDEIIDAIYSTSSDRKVEAIMSEFYNLKFRNIVEDKGIMNIYLNNNTMYK